MSPLREEVEREHEAHVHLPHLCVGCFDNLSTFETAF